MTQPVIFISYSPEDKEEKEKLISHLRVLQLEALIDLWSDDRIGPGADWEQEISQAVAQAKVAILLISANYLTSDFVLGKEVPALLQRREREGLIVFPVIARACAWQEVSWLAGMKVRPEGGRPIWGADRRRVDEALAAIAREVATIIKPAPTKPPQTSSPPPQHPIEPDSLSQILLKRFRDPIWQMLGVLVAIIGVAWAVYTFYANGNILATPTLTPKLSATIATVAAISTQSVPIVNSPTPMLINTPQPSTDAPTSTETPIIVTFECTVTERIGAVSLRAGPGASFETLSYLGPGDMVKILAWLESTDGLSWFQVSTSDDREGWIISHPHPEVGGLEYDCNFDPTQDFPMPKMVLVPAGPFTMGADAEVGLAECQKLRQDCELSWFEAEEPIHEVTLDAFYIDQYEVTNAQYLEFLQAQGKQEEGGVLWLATQRSRISQVGKQWQITTGYADHPVIGVTWYGARAYCEWREARLPTEAEWEKAARGTDGRIYPWGDKPPDETLLNFNGNIGGTTPVGSYPNGVSPYGVYDMAGNVFEWVADWYDDEYYSNSPAENPAGPQSGYDKVLRGGSWSDTVNYPHAANRLNINPDIQYHDIGFRCVSAAP